ncbi:MAG: signal peptidase I [Gammaproteobacteria bacterium]
MIITSTYLTVLCMALVFTGIAWLLDTEFFERHFSVRFIRFWRIVSLTLLLILIVYLCYENFSATLTLLVFGTGIIALYDLLFLARRRRAKNRPRPTIVENAYSFFGVLLIVWVIRSFIVQPYRMPTGSLVPTVMPGDLILVNQFTYGLRFPIMNLKIANIHEPKVGDIVLFYFPPHPEILFVKRVIGTPGDHVVYKNKVLYINNKEATQTIQNNTYDVEPGEVPVAAVKKMEDLNGVKHAILVRSDAGIEGQNIDITVPPGMYYMMGDNRDNSDDSRMWGFVPERNIVGKAFIVLLGWDPILHRIQWDRIGKWIH